LTVRMMADGPRRKSERSAPAMHDHGESDGCVVPRKPANKVETSAAEQVEGRDPAKGNSAQHTSYRAQDRVRLQEALGRIREVATGDKEARFTTLWHHVYKQERLREAFGNTKRDASPGVDQVSWEEYAADLSSNLSDLSDRLKRGAYRARPVRRVAIPKDDGGQRLIGIPALEDKIAQRATAEVLNAIYEVDFLGFSYGFRPGRSQHDALDALNVGITTKKINWVLDADIRGFFDAIDHDWLVRFVEHRIADTRVIRHIKKWLKAGVLEAGELKREEQGTPQGGSISPLLANVYLHYAFDLWAHQWRGKQANGDMIIVRYADDFIVGFQRRADAERFLAELKERLRKFGLELHPDKTRLIEFGRFAASNRAKRGEGKPESFDFLGFKHMCSKSRKKKFQIRRKTVPKRLKRKVKEIKGELRRRMHERVAHVGQWLRQVLTGHYQYYAVPLNRDALSAFRSAVILLWHKTLRRRSHKTKQTWRKTFALADRWLPRPRILHPWPMERFHVRHPRQEPSAVIPHAGICAGARQ